MRRITIDEGKRYTSFPLAIVVSRFNNAITEALLQGALDALAARGFADDDITVVDVPGAVEIPITAQALAKSGQYAVIIALGAVIRGDTSHYESVCHQVSDGCQRVALDSGIPVVFYVLTTENEAQAWDRLGGSEGHKGVDAVDTACAMYGILRAVSSS